MYSIISATRPLATSRLWRRRTWSLPPPPRAPQEPVPPPTRRRPPGRAQPPRSTRWSSLSPCPPQRRASARRLPNSSDYWSRWEHIHLFLNWICLCILRNIRWEPNFYFFMLFFLDISGLYECVLLTLLPFSRRCAWARPAAAPGAADEQPFSPPPSSTSAQPVASALAVFLHSGLAWQPPPASRCPSSDSHSSSARSGRHGEKKK